MTITCFYSCDNCGLHRIQVDVPARADETVTLWMEQLTRQLGADHRRRSPDCRPETLSNVLIPMTGDRVGGPTIQ